jgi:ketosteroid isomerase-like protein
VDHAYKAAFEARDVERWIAFYADDAQWLEYRPGNPPRAPNIIGKIVRHVDVEAWD